MTEMRAAPEYARAKVWLCFDDNHTHMAANNLLHTRKRHQGLWSIEDG